MLNRRKTPPYLFETENKYLFFEMCNSVEKLLNCGCVNFYKKLINILIKFTLI